MKIVMAAMAALLMMGVSAQAQMRGRAPSPFYVFGEYDYYSATGASTSGGGLGLGWNFNRYLGLQAGGQYLQKTGIDLTNFYAEAKLSWPISPNFSVYGSIGGAYASASGDITFPTVPPTTLHISDSNAGYRAGVGVEYWLGEHWGLRAGFHRQNAGEVDDDISAGIAFRF